MFDRLLLLFKKRDKRKKRTAPKKFDRPMLAVLSAFALGIVFLLFIQMFSLNKLIDDLELKTYDLRAYFQKGPFAQKPSKDIVIVEFDDPTLNNYEDEYGSWPWSRQVHADMLDFLETSGAKAIAFDIMFISPQRGDREGDQAFIKAFTKYQNVYVGMNFDNNKTTFEQMGKPFTDADLDLVKAYSMPLTSQLNFKNPRLQLDDSGFYSNDAMTFNHYRKIMPELLAVHDRIGFVNHGRDKDGVSRSNPIFFRLEYDKPVLTDALPIHQDSASGKWFDQKNRWVNQSGQLLEDTGRIAVTHAYSFYPYLGLRLLMGILYPPDGSLHPSKIPPMFLKSDGHLAFDNYDIPLSPTGTLLLKWYNTNYVQEELMAELSQLQGLKAKTSPRDTQTLQQIDQVINIYQTNLEHDFLAQPYQEISAWRVIKALQDEKNGKITATDQALKKFLKNKIIFIGTTAVSTFDIKTSPINKLLPGVVLQATLFDNLYQNTSYMHQADPFLNLMMTGFLCILSACLIIKYRSAMAGLGYTLCLAIIYVVFATFLFYHYSIWLNIANPIISLIMTTTLTFMIKYISRNKDYEATYHLATTDSMTGLKNHRFFQEQMLTSIQTAEKTQGKFSLVLIDIDHFKKFNDTHGHLCGDEVLRQVARKLKSVVRNVDLVARYGGEEMAIILDKANEAEALAVAEKVRKAIAEQPFTLLEGLEKHVTISIGVATYPTHGKAATELIEFSDLALYRAKKNGRNQVGKQYDNPSEERMVSSA